MTRATSDVLGNADLFKAAHPNWPGTSPGEYPLDLDGNVIPGAPASTTPALDWLRENTEVLAGPADDEDERLYREAAWE